ncbi:MAG: AsnC family transcriptional regulator [Halobacteriota archaeon]|nr:AsnC family transcriptional regulator [Halobacteriota archaeon]
MDSTDFEILKILNKNGRRSFLSIAKELKISGTAVQKRVERMINEGVILSFEVNFDVSLMQLNTCIADVKVKGKFITDEIISGLKKIPNIFFVIGTIGDVFTIMFYFESSKDLEQIIEQIGLVKGVSNVMTSIPRGYRPIDITLSPLDWKIIHSLNHNARKKNHEIAKELSVSPKTIKRRLDRLVMEKAIFFTVDVDLSRAKNYIIYLLIVDLKTGVRKGKIKNEIKNRFSEIWAEEGPVQPSIVFFMYARTLSEIGDVLEEVKKIPEVKAVTVSLYTSYYRFTEWFDKRLEEKVNLIKKSK